MGLHMNTALHSATKQKTAAREGDARQGLDAASFDYHCSEYYRIQLETNRRDEKPCRAASRLKLYRPVR
jgi:hypothetical protein